jgi:hypothetical protein
MRHRKPSIRFCWCISLSVIRPVVSGSRSLLVLATVPAALILAAIECQGLQARQNENDQTPLHNYASQASQKRLNPGCLSQHRKAKMLRIGSVANRLDEVG